MEELMRLYEKQKRLDEETKLKLANMQVQSAGVFQLRFPNVPHCIVFCVQERNGNLRREIEELRKTENELLKDHLEHWKHIKALHTMGLGYPHRAKDADLTGQAVVAIAENVNKNAIAADALLSELEQSSNVIPSPPVINKVPYLRITKGKF